MSGISKFKRFYSEGVAAEHPDVAGQKEFANRADEILAKRKKDRAQSGKNAKLDAIGRKLYNMNKIGEETELDEKIDVGADAGATISDFVHSKSKTFKGDSKKQRIKRALGAYYGAQKEETENIYNYVIETLVDSEFAQDYETAENMFECMSDEFVAVILEDYIEEKARGTRKKTTVHAYDVDETLFGHGKKGKPNVQVHVKDASGKRVQSLSNQEFNTHKLDKDKGHSYDFSEFQSAKTFSKTSTPNKKTIKDVKRKQARGQNVHIITARSKFDKPSEFQGHLKKHGVDVPMNKIHYTGGMKGGDIGKKKVDVAKGVAKQSGAKSTHMYDDAAKVNKAFEAEKENKPTSTKIKTHLAKPNASGETTLRSYQATKGGRTSDNPSSTTKQTQRRRKKARKNMGEEMTPYEFWMNIIETQQPEIVEEVVEEEIEEIVEEGPMTSYQKWKQYLEEAPTYSLDDNRVTRFASRIANSNNPVLKYIRNIPNPLLMDARGRVKPQPEKNKPTPKDSRLDSPTAGTGPEGNKVGSPVKPIPASQQRQGTGGDSGGRTPPQRPAAASGPVLSKKGGVEGTGVGANFKARAFTAAEKSRYSSVAAKNAAGNSASSGAPKPATPAIGKLGNTSFERRTPTSAELSAAIKARKDGASPEKALQAAQKTNLPTTGPTPATPDMKSVNAALSNANTVANLNRAPAGSAAAKALAVKPATSAPTSTQVAGASQGIKPINNKKPIKEMSSYEWPSAKTIRDIAGAYASIYEAKKKVDQDQDGDNDFADVRVARMIASGVPKAKAIAMVKDKSYNEEVEIDEATAMAKRGYDETEIRNKIAKSTGGGKFADKATALADRQTYGNKSKKEAREKLARTQRGDFRRTTSSNPGLHGYAYKSNDPAVKAKQAARGAQRGALTPNEKKELNREAYAAYEFVASYLLENNFASTVNDANVIINNMSEGWFESIMEG